MKKIIAIVVLILTTVSTINAQEWHTNFKEAKQIASTESKPIILVFQGSDWCAPCIKLDRQIWSTPTFKQYAKDNYVMLQADFPKRKKNALSDAQTAANAKLAEMYNKRGIFPYVVVLNANGKVLGETGYKKITPENYIKELNMFTK
ncbi:thioredoxin family protein [Polaribacter sp. Z014]|uniref:thioredoxin family protein n=1 Tax=unclassified Polaribacter TaxID=196858 RepID=UPI00193BA3C6|nr:MULTISPECIES: thioredoxin family protein [unclassified Polaribacter]MCL7763781.1 thioredoxin family protein [Polaribacter sp. Z014]QVY66560.1 thioredoxin family protein [Polaribacter sp. Q13]